MSKRLKEMMEAAFENGYFGELMDRFDQDEDKVLQYLAAVNFFNEMSDEVGELANEIALQMAESAPKNTRNATMLFASITLMLNAVQGLTSDEDDKDGQDMLLRVAHEAMFDAKQVGEARPLNLQPVQ